MYFKLLAWHVTFARSNSLQDLSSQLLNIFTFKNVYQSWSILYSSMMCSWRWQLRQPTQYQSQINIQALMNRLYPSETVHLVMYILLFATPQSFCIIVSQFHLFFLSSRVHGIQQILQSAEWLGRIVVLIYFCERISNNHHSFSLLTLPSIINQQKFSLTHTDRKWKCLLTFLVNATGRFPTKIVLASLPGSSSTSLDFLFFTLDFLTRIPSSSSLLEKQQKQMKAIDHKFLTGTFLQGITIRRVFYPVPDINLRLTSSIKFTVRKVIVVNLNDSKVRKKSLGHKLVVSVAIPL